MVKISQQFASYSELEPRILVKNRVISEAAANRFVVLYFAWVFEFRLIQRRHYTVGWVLTCKMVSEMTYNVSSGTLNHTIPYVCLYLQLAAGGTASSSRRRIQHLSCSECNRTFTQRSNLLRHLGLVHGLTEDRTPIDAVTRQRYADYSKRRPTTSTKRQDRKPSRSIGSCKQTLLLCL